MKAWERLLKLWAKEYREGLDERVQDLIGMAHCDLWYGPYDAATYADEDPNRKTQWPGFETACREITRALDDLPSALWLDMDCEQWSEDEPATSEDCWACDGTDADCETCQGTGRVEACLENWVVVDRADLIRALAGKELAAYI